MAVVARCPAVRMEYGSDCVMGAAVVLVHDAEPLVLSCDHDEDSQVAGGVTEVTLIRMRNPLLNRNGLAHLVCCKIKFDVFGN